MNIKKMLEALEPREIDGEQLIANLRNQLVDLFNDKSVDKYAVVLRDMLHIAVFEKHELILKHFAAAPVVARDETMQLQEMFTCLALRSRNRNWFLDLFALFLGLAVVLRFPSADVENAFFKGKD
ncbi:hypothetical protein [Brevibacillus parabrevis]|jgi:dimeric dUTPase (all-alpha-NTP-PPase superfamily)|uniref:Uncharacterized protein n=1 Tax=Brevibacillus parabrevis TaxID=54914 RepID=A0A4Y3PAL1_BREPA|nr:hypothetical protein [Brevibacillus parabrevis]RNB93514.1 hypothetical protein EDM60_20940 [Brevibacillus parabrevis]GEB31452.1 hypothetical protein BPA01_10320 [Brevibacillus parabrevis]